VPEDAREILGPVSSSYVSQRLRLHYVDWGNQHNPPLILVHGGRDHARSWDWVARELRRDWHVVAPDLRGHGDSSWAIGGHYTLPEFTLDLAQLVDLLDVPQVSLVGHSLGGAVCIQYAAVFPERVARLVAIEGLGPPPQLASRLAERPPWQRIADWIGQVREFSARQPRRYPSIEAAAKRMLEENSFLSEEQAHHLTLHGVNRHEDGTYAWKFDNYVRVFYPQRYDAGETRELWGRIGCPTLLVYGTESWAGDPAVDGRVQAFAQARVVGIPGAGHWVHHDRLDDFLGELRTFLVGG
jgi:pimeloyl-ACP methyl ester carboxylesterase